MALRIKLILAIGWRDVAVITGWLGTTFGAELIVTNDTTKPQAATSSGFTLVRLKRSDVQSNITIGGGNGTTEVNVEAGCTAKGSTITVNMGGILLTEGGSLTTSQITVNSGGALYERAASRASAPIINAGGVWHQQYSFGCGQIGINGSNVSAGIAAPNGSVVGNPGDIYLDQTGGASNTFWVKETGIATNTGWIAYGASGSSAGTQHARVSAGTIPSATISTPITVNWSTPFADNNYTVLATAVIGEATSDGAVTSIICIASVELQANGAGVLVTVSNADSIAHTVTINLYAVHD